MKSVSNLNARKEKHGFLSAYQIQDNSYKIRAVRYIGMSLVLFFAWFHIAYAASFTVTPAVINEKAKARDILKESVTLTNNLANKINVYAFVNNIAIREGKQEFLDPSRADHSSSLANWIMIRRGFIELLPGEKKKIDFDIEVNLRAKPGMYHALINFAEASTRAEAEAKIAGAPSVTVNLEVFEDIKERLQLKSFISDKTFFFGFPVSFSYELENIGNRPVLPLGEIRIYDRRGREVTSMQISEAASAIAPAENIKIVSSWSGLEKSSAPLMLASVASALGVGGGFGKYKAVLDIEYGVVGKTLQDTVFFWVIPLWPITILWLVIVSFSMFLLWAWYSRNRSPEARISPRKDAKVIDLRKKY